LGGYAANLPPERWISRVLAWNPLGRRRSGCPRTSWPSKFISYTRYRHLGNWQVLARDPDLWRGLMDDFCMFCGREWNAVVVCIILWCWSHLSHLRPNGLPTGVQVQSQSQSQPFRNKTSHSVGESHSSRKDEVTDHLVNYDDTIDAYWLFLTSLLVSPILIPMRVPLFVIGNVALDDHKCNDDVFWIFFRRDKVYMRLNRANALYADSLEHSLLSSNEAIWIPYISFQSVFYTWSIWRHYSIKHWKCRQSRAHGHKGGAGGGDDDEEEAHDEL